MYKKFRFCPYPLKGNYKPVFRQEDFIDDVPLFRRMMYKGIRKGYTSLKRRVPPGVLIPDSIKFGRRLVWEECVSQEFWGHKLE